MASPPTAPNPETPTAPAADTGVAEPAEFSGQLDVSDKRDDFEASQWRLVWRGFRRHKLAMAGAIIVIGFYLVALLAEFFAPLPASQFDADHPFAPPQRLHVVDTTDGWDFGFYVHDYTSSIDPDTFEVVYDVDETEKIDVRFFAKGEEYRLFGVIPWDRHLIGPSDPDERMFLLGTDRLGRDMLSRIIHGARVSMTIGLVGVALAFLLGVVLGGISGYFGGRVDTLVQRAVEFFMSIPSIPLWLGLAAALPAGWGPLQRYFAITIILAVIAWTELARVVRGRFLSLRQEDFITSAHLDGNSQPRVIFRHMLPSFTSHLIASLTLSIPAMILAETAISFLGLGLQPPVVSWGVLLQDAQSVNVIANAPWLMLPGVVVIIAILAFNFAGDGLRDAADPYRR